MGQGIGELGFNQARGEGADADEGRMTEAAIAGESRRGCPGEGESGGVEGELADSDVEGRQQPSGRRARRSGSASPSTRRGNRARRSAPSFARGAAPVIATR